MPDPLEVQFYEAVATEIEEGLFDKGLMAMATAKSLGDKGLARSLYIELRVEQMRAEATPTKAEARRAKKAAKEARRREARKKKDPEWAEVVRKSAEGRRMRAQMRRARGNGQGRPLDLLPVAILLAAPVALLLAELRFPHSLGPPPRLLGARGSDRNATAKTGVGVVQRTGSGAISGLA